MTNHHRTRARRALTAVAVSTCAGLALTGCQLTSAGADQDATSWSKTCPSGKQVAGELRLDASGSYGSAAVDGAFKDALTDLTSRIAMCGGRLRVVAFSGSNAGTAVLFDGPISVKGSTAQGRARRVPEAVGEVIAAVESKLPIDTSTLTGGSDIAGQLDGAWQTASQLGDGYVLDEVILTDGLDNKTLPTAEILDAHTAETTARKIDVPELAGAWVTFAGLGEVSGKPRDTAVASALIAFYTALCNRTGAERCTAVSDYVSPIGG